MINNNNNNNNISNINNNNDNNNTVSITHTQEKCITSPHSNRSRIFC